MEKIGRRFWRAGGELRGTGDDGGLDQGSSSEKIAGESFGLDGGDVGVSRAGDEVLRAGEDVVAVRFLASVCSSVVSTRLRLVGGSSS
jgi:hypothetical protein